MESNQKKLGRPFKSPDDRRKRIDLRLPPHMIIWLEMQGGITFTIEKMIQNAMKDKPAE